MKKIKKNKWFILVILVIGGLFYWFQYRPSEIRKDCYKEVEDMAGEVTTLMRGTGKTGYDKIFTSCLNRNGIK